MAGDVIGLRSGESVTVGRAAGRAEFALPHDTFMSGVHFAVECRPGGCRVQDLKSSNGTFLNGARIQDAMLANGDEIKGGQTIFAVKIVADAKLASLMPPEEVAPPPTPQPRPRAVEPVPASALQSQPPASPPQPRSADPLSVQELQPPVDAAQPPRPRASEPALPAALESRPLAAEPASPAVLPAARLADEPKPAPPARSPIVGPPPPAKELPPKLEPLAGDFSARAEEPAKRALPPVEPPRFHAIPGLPGVGAKPPHAGENSPRVGEQPPRRGESPPGADAGPPNSGAKPPRREEPPAGVAPFIAEKFAERPGSRGVGSSRGAAFSVMGWSFPAAPAEWLVQEGFGLQQSGHEEFPSSVAATEELLGGITLPQFVESQISMLRGYLRDAKIEPTMPPRVGGADESMAMDVRHSTKDGRELVYRRIYARSGASVGVLTVTTLAADLPQVLQSLQPLLDGAAFRATVNN